MAGASAPSSSLHGYWGSPSSTVDWCEGNYLVTPYIAEFFNSTTSFFIVAAGLLPLLLHRHLWEDLELRCLLACCCVCVVGLGSAAFHGTLQFRHQMWDEVPMLWTVVVMMYCLLEQEYSKPSFGWPLPVSLALYAAFATYATAGQDGNVQWFSFHTFFAACEFPCLFLWYRFFQKLDSSEGGLRSSMRCGFAAYVCAIAVWLIDLNFCAALQQLPGYSFWNLHSFGWHLLTSYGLYIGMVGLWYHRLRVVHGREVLWTGVLLPRILLDKKA